jgi:hypothetical protein
MVSQAGKIEIVLYIISIALMIAGTELIYFSEAKLVVMNGFPHGYLVYPYQLYGFLVESLAITTFTFALIHYYLRYRKSNKNTIETKPVNNS